MSRALRLIAGVSRPAFALLLMSCLPGPWDFMATESPSFRGIYTFAYAVADKPAENFCFERLLALTEAHTDAFPFYQSQSVTLAGNFSTGGQTLVLQPKFLNPKCFSGPASALFLRGESYALTAQFTWDSAGSSVTTTLQATARIPRAFSITDTAVAPSLAITGLNLAALFQDPVTAFQKLPPVPQQILMTEYGDSLAAFGSDSIGRSAYLRRKGAAMMARVIELLQSDQTKYLEGDTLFYIGGGAQLNLLSHFYHSVRSDDVTGALITHRYDTTESKPVTAFDSIAVRLGFALDTGDFYYPGNIHRLGLFPSTRSDNGYNILDSLGVVNGWFWTGLNRLYFYGVEKTYTDYVYTNVAFPGAGPVDQNPKTKALTNVTGGRGFFTGMVLDSFDLYIKLDSVTEAFSYPVTRAFVCSNEDGWFGSRDCAGWYREYCRTNNWQHKDCRLDGMYISLDSAERLTAQSWLLDSALAWKSSDTAKARETARRYCIDKNYPALVPECTAVQSECETGANGNDCQDILWKKCEYDYWKPAACVEGRKSYCASHVAIQPDLCRGVAPN